MWKLLSQLDEFDNIPHDDIVWGVVPGLLVDDDHPWSSWVRRWWWGRGSGAVSPCSPTTESEQRRHWSSLQRVNFSCRSESSNLSLVVYTFSRAAILLFGAVPLNSYEYFAIAIEIIVSCWIFWRSRHLCRSCRPKIVVSCCNENDGWKR